MIRYEVVYISELDGLEVFCFNGTFEECCDFAQKKSELQSLTLTVRPCFQRVVYKNGQQINV